MTKKIISFLVICFLLGMPLGMNNYGAKGETWEQNSSTDFNSGTLSNLEVSGTGVDAKLELGKQDENGRWVQRNINPTARSYHAMCYDSQDNLVVLFGGDTGSSENDETWVYNVTTNSWEQKTQATSPPTRQKFGMAYDSYHNRVVLFGGIAGATRMDSTWVYDVFNNTWEKKTPSSKPSARDRFGFVYDAKNKVFVLFGGNDDSGKNGETWTYELGTNTWTNEDPSGDVPDSRYGTAMAYDSTSERVILFGGSHGPDETWAYNTATNSWTERNPSSSPHERRYHTMAYDSSNDRTVLFGGWYYDEGDYYLQDTWAYDYSNDLWTNKNPTTKPTERSGTAMAYASNSGDAVLFGGFDGTSINSETWAYDYNDWEQKTSAVRPSQRFGHSMTYDSTNEKVVMFGGGSGFVEENNLCERVDGETINCGQWNDIAIDSQDRPHISYHDETNQALKYAYWTGSSWDIRTLDSSTNIGDYTSIALDSNDYPHISYYSDAGFDLMYIKKTSIGWSTSTTVRNGASDDRYGYYSSIALDSGDRPHIASYRSNNQYNLYYSYWTGSSWLNSDIETTGNVGLWCDIALDSHDEVYISYFDEDPDQLQISYTDQEGWQNTIIDTDADVGRHSSIAIDTNDHIHIAYFDETNDNLKYAYSTTGSSWTTETVDNAAYDVGRYSSIAVDSNNRPHICYSDFTYSDLQYAYYTGISWMKMTVDAPLSIRYYTSIALDSGDTPHISYYNESSADLKYVKLDKKMSGMNEETWQYNIVSSTWTNKTTSKAPDKRGFFTEAYDSINDKMILFGGVGENKVLSDTWAYSSTGNFWIEKSPIHNPSARYNHSMCFDSQNALTVLFGGSYTLYALNDTWVYDYTKDDWYKRTPSTSPTARAAHAMVYDPDNKVIILFGGFDGTTYLDDTWIYNVGTNTWTQRYPQVKPTGRSGHTMVYDTENNKMIMFGGQGSLLNDIWTYDYTTNNWTLKSLSQKPDARNSHAMVYDSSENKMLLFGGYNGTSATNDSWIYTLNYYSSTGTYISDILDASSYSPVEWVSIRWDQTSQPDGTSLKFQVAVNTDGVTWNFVGPGGSSSAYYSTADGQALYTELRGNFMRVKAFFTTYYSHRTPSLDDVTITYRQKSEPSIILYSPNGGETLMNSTSHIITWDSFGDLSTTPINIYYTTDGGMNWNLIASDQTNTGYHNWTVPDEETQIGLIKVTVIDIYGNNISDVCDRTFAIDPPPGGLEETNDMVLSPKSGDKLTSGENATIEWRLKGPEKVSLYYSTDFQQTWILIEENIDDTFEFTNKYIWSIPENLESEYLIVMVKGEVQGDSLEIQSGFLLVGPPETDGTVQNAENDSGDIPVNYLLTACVITFIGLITFVVSIVVSRQKRGRESN